MEWGDRANAAAVAEAEERSEGGEPLGYVKVMTDEQMEVLRKQISIYATICEQLVEMHRALTEHQDPIAGRSVLSVLVGFGAIQEFWVSSFALSILRVPFTAGAYGRTLFSLCRRLLQSRTINFISFCTRPSRSSALVAYYVMSS
jgi:hypothetical protein